MATVLIATFLLSISYSAPYQTLLPAVHAQTVTAVASVSPSTNALLVGSTGDVRIDIPVPGIAVRIEIPREFLQGVVSGENDTHFITSDIRNDYYYYSLVDESAHWTYDWHGEESDGPCYKPNFSFYDPNAPYCVEIWNYLNFPGFMQPDPTITNYCSLPTQAYVFRCFTPPKFVLFHDLAAPSVAGIYNFTLSVATRTNALGYPDFVNAYAAALFVPVSMAYNAGFIYGSICDRGSTPCGPIRGRGVVYAKSVAGAIVARAYVDQTLCDLGRCGLFNLTGLAPGPYTVEGSAGLDHGYAYSLTPYAWAPDNPLGVPSIVSPNAGTSIGNLPLRRAPLFCGLIEYENANGNPILSLEGQTYLLKAGFNPAVNLNITVEATDSFGHVFRFQNVSGGTSIDPFTVATGFNVSYVGTDPYGTEFAGLPAPEDVSPSGYTLSVQVWVSGYVQLNPEAAVIFQSPGQVVPTCGNSVGATFGPNPVVMRMGGVISGTLQFCASQPLQACIPESPDEAEKSLGVSLPSGSLFGGNIVIQAYDQAGVLRGVTVIAGTLPNGTTGYASCNYSGNCTSLGFYMVGFTEYYNHTLSGVWREHDSGLPAGTYSLEVYVRGYELASCSPATISITGGSSASVIVYMTRGGAFEVTVSSFDNIFGTLAVQAMLPWRFLNSSIPVSARVYFYDSSGRTVGYVEVLMVNAVPNELGVLQVTTEWFTVIFAGQNWSLREIWFYGYTPTHITNDVYTIKAYTLGYVRQYPGGVTSPNTLVGFGQAYIVLFVANEVDVTVPLFSNPLSRTFTKEYAQSIGEVFSSGLTGAETANLTAGQATPGFNIYGFGGMQLNTTLRLNSTYQITLCQTDEFGGLDNLGVVQNICGQGHFFYVGTDGTLYYDYGLGVGTYTELVPEFGFTAHFLQVSASPVIQFTDLFLESGFVVQAIQMARVIESSPSLVQGWNDFPFSVAPLSWAQVHATNATYYRSVPTLDGYYDGVNALFLPGGVYNVTFSDVQYQSQAVSIALGWGGSYPLSPPTPLCPSGTTC